RIVLLLILHYLFTFRPHHLAFFFSRYTTHLNLHSFPTRRSSDLDPQTASIAEQAGVDRIFIDLETVGKQLRQGGMNTVQSHHTRSEEHTSELQSRFDLVCRLLLEKKKKKTQI